MTTTTITTPAATLELRLGELKQRFDAAFGLPPTAAEGSASEDLLGVAIGSERYLLRLREVTGLYLERAITPVPSALPHLLGVADFRGELVAVYDLAAVLGYTPAAQPRYLVRIAQRALGFAFERFDGHLRVNAGDSGPAAHAHAIVDVPGLVVQLEQQAASVAAREA